MQDILPVSRAISALSAASDVDGRSIVSGDVARGEEAKVKIKKANRNIVQVVVEEYNPYPAFQDK